MKTMPRRGATKRAKNNKRSIEADGSLLPEAVAIALFPTLENMLVCRSLEHTLREAERRTKPKSKPKRTRKKRPPTGKELARQAGLSTPDFLEALDRLEISLGLKEPPPGDPDWSRTDSGWRYVGSKHIGGDVLGVVCEATS
jgi:hypothetical protein